MAHGSTHRPETSDAPSRRVQTEGIFRKCEACGDSVTVMALQRNLDVCPVSGCGHHFQISALRRLEITLDPGSFHELFANLEPLDILEFKARRSYAERLREAQRATGLKDAVVCGEGKIHGQDVVLAVMDPFFISGSMGSVVGEKVTRTIEHATAAGKPVLLFCCSGGARMDEGVLSLMQMAKTAAALQRHDQAGLVCLTVLTHPTLAGVSASFAFLGDIIIAEPKALIGFTGARVIEQTIKKKLPEGFQEAEFLLLHGQIDMVVERKNMRETLAKLLAFIPLPQPSAPKEGGHAPRERAELVEALVADGSKAEAGGHPARRTKPKRRKGN